MLIRIRSPQGVMHRLTVESHVLVNDAFYQNVLKICSLEGVSFVLVKCDSRTLVPRLDQPLQRNQSLAQQQIQHGDVIAVVSQDKEMSDETRPSASNAKEVDPLDAYLQTQKGLILRSRDARLCHHTEKAMCEHCQPLEPFDANYLKEKKIKHLSHYAYLRRQKQSVFNEAVAIPDLKVKKPCPSGHHAPYPQGLCTQCQPSAVTLQPQVYRHVDHVAFDSAVHVERLLQGWRTSGGCQRFCWLYGYYTAYDVVPLGVQCHVVAIYEPLQENAKDGIELLETEEANKALQRVDELASLLGLKRVGCMYTDLTAGQNEKVVCKRHSDSYFVSSLEVLFMARWQALLGSRFVTLIVTGDRDENVAVFGYQVSDRTLALYKADWMEACVDPSLMRVLPSTRDCYVPEVFYKYRNQYGLDVKHAAMPTFPVAYLLVTLTHGFPSQPRPFFDKPTIPVPSVHDPSMPNKVWSLVKQYDWSILLEWQVLVYFYWKEFLNQQEGGTQWIRLLKAYARPLDVQGKQWKTVNVEEREEAVQSWQSSTDWQTLSSLAANHTPSSNTFSSQSTTKQEPWNCSHCTFRNFATAQDCDMCGLPK